MEFAPAKINLTLHVTGLREDGYHLLDSLVVFVDVGDQISVTASDVLSLSLTGTEAQGLAAEPDNLVMLAAKLVGVTDAHITLEKNLPTSSGIGGGSADAAATLRALTVGRGRPLPSSQDVLKLGADVPVCLKSKSVRMKGVGEILLPILTLPEMHLVLVNPRQTVSTPEIFKHLKDKHNSEMDTIPKNSAFDAFIAWLKLQRNDLQAPAVSLVPAISNALSAIENTHASIARMSGSGATCFGIYRSSEDAENAATQLSDLHPDWWVKSAIVI